MYKVTDLATGKVVSECTSIDEVYKLAMTDLKLYVTHLDECVAIDIFLRENMDIWQYVAICAGGIESYLFNSIVQATAFIDGLIDFDGVAYLIHPDGSIEKNV